MTALYCTEPLHKFRNFPFNLLVITPINLLSYHNSERRDKLSFLQNKELEVNRW